MVFPTLAAGCLRLLSSPCCAFRARAGQMARNRTSCRREGRGKSGKPSGPNSRLPTSGFLRILDATAAGESIDFIEAEWLDWYGLEPAERWAESEKLWNTFILLGGNFEPEPDTQSPFFDASAPCAVPPDGGTSVRVLRSCGI